MITMDIYSGSIWWIPFIIMAVFCLAMMFGRFRGGSMGCMPMHSGHDHHDQTDGETETSIEIVKRRYAKGEIKRDEYDHIVRKLTE